MGVDIATYRGRIGTFGHGCGQDVYTTETVLDFTRSLKSIGTVVFIGLLLVIAGVEPNPGPMDEVGGRRSLQNDGEIPSRGNNGNRRLEETKFVKLKGLPHDTSVRFLKMFCREKGTVLNVSIDETDRTALIEFEDVCAAVRFLDSQPIVIHGTEVEVMPHYDEALRTIKITNIPSEEDAKHILTFYFKTVEGEPISSININRKEDFAIVTFKSAEVARRMVERKSFRIDDLCLLVSGITETNEDHIPPMKPEDNTNKTLPEIHSEAKSVEQDTYRESAKNKKDDTEEMPYTFDELVEPLENNVKTESTKVERKKVADVLCKVIYQREASELIKADSAEDNTAQTVLNPDAAAGPLEKECNNEPLENDSARQTVHKSESDVHSQHDSTEEAAQTVLNLDAAVELLEKDTNSESAGIDLARPTVNKSISDVPSLHYLTEDNTAQTILNPDAAAESLERVTNSESAEKDSTRHTINKWESDVHSPHDLKEDNTAKTLLNPDTAAESLEKDTNNESARIDLARPTVHKSESDILSHHVSPESPEDIIKMLGLEDKYPGNISMRELLSIDIKQKPAITSYTDLPWTLLRAMLVCHCDCRDSIIADALECLDTNRKGYDAEKLNEESHYKSISPLDLFHVVIQCCDPLVKNLLFKKMFLCRIAVPFSHKKIVSIWPLRFLPIEWNGTLYTAAQIPTVTTAFARIGRPGFSKSKFLNTLLSKEGFNTFYNEECPLGSAERIVSQGNTEMFWLLPPKGDIIRTVFNLRGDMERDFDEIDQPFVSKITDIIAIVIDLDNITKHARVLRGLIEQFNHIILIINNPNQGQDEQEKFVESLLINKKIQVMRTYKNKKYKQKNNFLDLNKIILELFECLKCLKPITLEQRLSEHLDIKRDEEKNEIQTANECAICVFQCFESSMDQEDTKSAVTPAHSLYAKSLGKLKREMCRIKVTDRDIVETKYFDNMKKQISSTTPTIKMFAHKLIQCKAQSTHLIRLFISTLSMMINSKMEKILSKLIVQNKKEFEELWALQNDNASQVNEQKGKIKRSNTLIENATFSIKHLFRELMQLYNAFLQTEQLVKNIGLPQTNEVIDVFVQLFIHGYPFELLNGEDNFMPIYLIKEVLKKAHDIIPKAKMFALAILGMQSSGKSTLLNTMFGSQFAVSSGRCTRGVHIQLLRLTNAHKQPFNYILLIDTEGLRAPDHLRNERSFNHDNELATFVAGLGDMTILNIMGENMSEIGDTLQIVVHAFLRLKLANNNLDVKKSCLFVHHNVAEVTASDKMHQGFQKIITTLDAMTKEAALSEGIVNIERFNQVIEFEITSHVWYFPNLWLGNPPSAKVNEMYSNKANSLRSHLIRNASTAVGKSYKHLQSIFRHIDDLWKAVIQEDFVFSFRNTSAIMAYCWLEKGIQDVLWKAECSAISKLQEAAANIFSKCSSVDELKSKRNDINQKQLLVLEDCIASARKEMTSLFESSDFKDIINTWRPDKELKFEKYCDDLNYRCVSEMDRLNRKREIEISTSVMCKGHEQKLYDMSKSLINRIKGKTIDDSEVETQFKKVLCDFEVDLPKSDDTKLDITKAFELQMGNILHKDHAALKKKMEEKNWPKYDININSLRNSVDNIGLKEKDFSATIWFPTQKIEKFLNPWSYERQKKTNFDIIAPYVQSLFSDLDDYIKRMVCIDCEILEQHIKEFLHKIEQWIDDIKKEQARIGLLLTPKFKIKIFLHASCYAVKRFEVRNANYEKEHGAAALFKRYETHARVRLDAMMKERSAEDTAAFLFTSAVADFVRDDLKHIITSKVIEHLFQLIPRPKYYLMTEVVTDLAKAEHFGNWIAYLISARSLTQKWIEAKCIANLFVKERSYSEIAMCEVDFLYTNILQAIRKNQHVENKSRKTVTWINSFSACMKNYHIPSERFNSMTIGFDEITSTNIKEFSDLLMQKLKESQESIKSELADTTEETVKWGTSNPYEEIFARIWGCSETCPFCRETCAKESHGSEQNHNCIQHRPSGCIGIHQERTMKINLTSCNYDVQSDQTHRCGVFRFMCNNGKNEPCDSKIHKYKDFRKFAPHWNIETNADMEDTSKMWMWFMAKYKDELKKQYNVVVDHIPASWSKITKEDAIESYRGIMSGM